MIKSTFVQLASALLALAPLGCAGTVGDSGSPPTVETEQALQAASPTCASARDNCRMLAQPIIDQVQAACAGVRTACHHGGTLGGAGGAGAGSTGTTVSCADARAACTAAVTAAQPQLQAVGQQCQPAVQSSCLVSDAHGGGAAGGATGTGSAGPPVTTGAGGAGPGGPPVTGGTGTPSQACTDAQTACQQALAGAGTMPPASCLAVSGACMSTSATTSTTDCTTAIDTCHSDVDAIVQAVQQHCGKDLISSCRR